MAEEQKAPEVDSVKEIQSRISQLEEEVRRLREVIHDLTKDPLSRPEHK